MERYLSEIEYISLDVPKRVQGTVQDPCFFRLRERMDLVILVSCVSSVMFVHCVNLAP